MNLTRLLLKLTLPVNGIRRHSNFNMDSRFWICHDRTMTANSNHQKAHYGWVIIATGALVLFACLGLARYAYTMLLPAMQQGLGFSYDRMGFIGTANFIGYLLAVLMAPLFIKRFHPRSVITAGLVLIALSMACISQGNGFITLLLLYLLTGMGGGFANIPLMALITCWFRSRTRGRAAGLIIGGNGLAIICAGFLIPALNRWQGDEGWRTAWLLLALTTLAVAAVAWLLLRNSPAEMGLEPMGEPLPATQLLPPAERKGDAWLLTRLGLLYLAFGITFMIYGTFIVATLVAEHGFSEARAGQYWSLVGFCSVFSGVLFGSLSDRIGRKHGLALVFLVQSIAYLLVGIKAGPIGLLVSIILYGSAVFAIPAIMAAATGDYLGASRAASSFAVITVFFAAGQTAGPAIAGVIGKYAASFGPAYLASAAVTLVAALCSLLLPEPGNDQNC